VTDVVVDAVSVAYDGVEVVHDLSMKVRRGDSVTIIGPNGAGKTTFLKAIAGLVPFEGTIRLADDEIADLDRRALARMVAYVPQRPMIPYAMSVTDYVLMGRTPYISYFGVEGASDVSATADVLERLELTTFNERQLGSLSGGEIQRVVLARALAQDAGILLLDEPTSALDVGHQQQVLELVDALRREKELTVISTMHDLTLAGQFSHMLVLLDGGRPVATGDPRSVLTEALIERHYGASVNVVDQGPDGIAVVPRRTRVEQRP
jgi:iron complex transport system ATP-binding protein